MKAHGLKYTNLCKLQSYDNSNQAPEPESDTESMDIKTAKILQAIA